jgi:hypothetical protein
VPHFGSRLYLDLSERRNLQHEEYDVAEWQTRYSFGERSMDQLKPYCWICWTCNSSSIGHVRNHNPCPAPLPRLVVHVGREVASSRADDAVSCKDQARVVATSMVVRMMLPIAETSCQITRKPVLVSQITSRLRMSIPILFTLPQYDPRPRHTIPVSAQCSLQRYPNNLVRSLPRRLLPYRERHLGWYPTIAFAFPDH